MLNLIIHVLCNKPLNQKSVIIEWKGKTQMHLNVNHAL